MTHKFSLSRLERDYKDGIGAMLTSNNIKELLQEVKEKDATLQKFRDLCLEQEGKRIWELSQKETEITRRDKETARILADNLILARKIKELEARIEDLNDEK